MDGLGDLPGAPGVGKGVCAAMPQALSWRWPARRCSQLGVPAVGGRSAAARMSAVDYHERTPGLARDLSESRSFGARPASQAKVSHLRSKMTAPHGADRSLTDPDMAGATRASDVSTGPQSHLSAAPAGSASWVGQSSRER